MLLQQAYLDSLPDKSYDQMSNKCSPTVQNSEFSFCAHFWVTQSFFGHFQTSFKFLDIMSWFHLSVLYKDLPFSLLLVRMKVTCQCSKRGVGRIFDITFSIVMFRHDEAGSVMVRHILFRPDNGIISLSIHASEN